MLLINNQTAANILDMKGCIEALEIGYRDQEIPADGLLRFCKSATAISSMSAPPTAAVTIYSSPTTIPN